MGLINWSAFRLRAINCNFSWQDGPYQVLCIVIIVLLGLWVASFAFKERKKKEVDVPILLENEIPNRRKRANEYTFRSRELLAMGYEKYPDQVFGITTHDGNKYVLPPKFIDELKSHPNLSFIVSIGNDMLTEFTKFGGPPERFMHTLKADLNPKLSEYIPVLQQLAREHVPHYLGKHDDWEPVVLYDKTYSIVSRLAARVFLGSEASNSETWLETTGSYVSAVVETIFVLKQVPQWTRRFIFPFLPQRAAINKTWARARPFVESCMRRKKEKGGTFLEQPGTLLDFFCTGKNAVVAENIEEQLRYQMNLVAVGTLTTHASILQVFYDLAAHQEYVNILREEVKENVDENGDLSKTALSNMKKLDSFLKETQRLSSPDLTTFQRSATADVTLSDGTIIPKGTKIELATSSIHLDEKNYTNATKFDGLRFYRMRQRDGEENKHLFVSVGRADLAFGYGKLACPGRYLSQMMIKIILTEFLLNYDIKLPDGEKRPESLTMEAMVVPNDKAAISLTSIPNSLQR